MKREEIEQLFQATLAGETPSREERKRLASVLRDAGLSRDEQAHLRGRAFTAAKARVADPHARRMLEWLEDLVRALGPAGDVAPPGSEVFFSPGDQCLRAVRQAFARARAHVDICVFTITDDRIAEAILEAHHRGTSIRIVTDNDKANDEGSDVARLARAGIAVRVDRTEFHMHHKFALFDGNCLLNGSYNWTRSAASSNDENLILTHESNLVRKFAAHFEKLWARFA